MNAKILVLTFGIIFTFPAVTRLYADQLEMQNGDRFSGKVLAVSAESVVLESELIGKVSLPRSKVTRLAFGTNTLGIIAGSNAVRLAMPTNPPTVAALVGAAKTNGGTSLAQHIREQMLAGSPEAASKYDEMLTGLMNGKLNIKDLRREAKASAEQLQELKRELGADADGALDGYLEVLNNFLHETVMEPTNAASGRILR